MIYLLLTAWFWWNEWFSLNQISRNNQARQEAQQAYQAGHYHQALALYTYLGQTTTTIDLGVRLNLGHTYFQLKQYKRAKAQYETLLQTERVDLRTVAATQLGVIACLEGDSTRALVLFEQALLENADNAAARYNFELVKTYYAGPREQHQRPPTVQGMQPKLVNKPKAMGSKQVEQSERQDDVLKRFRRLNMSEEQALQLLDAMQKDDLPYALIKSARKSSAASAQGGNYW